MFHGIEQYWELCDLLLSLKEANKNNCNFGLIMVGDFCHNISDLVNEIRVIVRINID